MSQQFRMEFKFCTFNSFSFYFEINSAKMVFLCILQSKSFLIQHFFPAFHIHSQDLYFIAYQNSFKSNNQENKQFKFAQKIILFIFLVLIMSENDDMRLYLIVETSLRIVIDISFMVLYLFRIHKLDRMASNNFQSKPKLMKFKIILLVALLVIFVTHIILSFTDQSYWINPYQDFALISIAQIINCILQIYIIRKQHKKKALKASSVPFIWILWLLLDIITIIFVQIKIPSTSVILLVFQGIAFVALVVIGCILEQKNQSNQEILNSMNTALINDSRVNSLKQSDSGSQCYDSNKLYVQFNKEFNISMKENEVFYEFKFASYIGEESNILLKTEQSFIHLAAQMMRTFPQCQQLKLPQRRKQSYSNMKQYGEEKQRLYQTYLVKLTQNQKYYTTFLMEFLQVSPLNRIKLTKKRQKQLFHKKDSFHNQDEQKHRRPFFKVQLVNGKIHISNSQILEIVLNKSRSQIQKFHNKLISQKKLKMQLLNENPDMNQMIHFIFRVVNSKFLWKCFSQWLVLGKELEQKIFNMFDFWNFGFKNIKISIIGYQIAFDKEGSIHNLYLISLSQKEKSISTIMEQPFHIFLKEDVTLKKRFNDFVKLDKNIKKFINQNNIKNHSIMSLPPKFSPFGTKTSPKSRQIYLDMYLNQILKIEQINHCVKFLQFLEVDLGRFKEEFHTVNEDDLASQHISSMVIDELQEHG